MNCKVIYNPDTQGLMAIAKTSQSIKVTISISNNGGLEKPSYQLIRDNKATIINFFDMEAGGLWFIDIFDINPDTKEWTLSERHCLIGSASIDTLWSGYSAATIKELSEYVKAMTQSLLNEFKKLNCTTVVNYPWLVSQDYNRVTVRTWDGKPHEVKLHADCPAY